LYIYNLKVIALDISLILKAINTKVDILSKLFDKALEKKISFGYISSSQFRFAAKAN